MLFGQCLPKQDITIELKESLIGKINEWSIRIYYHNSNKPNDSIKCSMNGNSFAAAEYNVQMQMD